jgi:hypothetical protein
MPNSSLLSSLQVWLGVLSSAGFIVWRLGRWANRRLEDKIMASVTTGVSKGIQDAFATIKVDVSAHTLQIASLHQQLRTHRRQITQLAYAGAETTASAAIWAKKAPSPREVDLQMSDWRKIVSDEEVDHKGD